MVVVYRCRVCGYVLYVFERVGLSSYGVPTPSEVASWFGGRCPGCGRRLGRPCLEDVYVVADRELVRMRVELLKRELEEFSRMGFVAIAYRQHYLALGSNGKRWFLPIRRRVYILRLSRLVGAVEVCRR